MSQINLAAPAGFTTAVLIADEIQAPGGSPDAVSSGLTINNSNPVSAALELQSTLGALLISRMTTTQRNALNPTKGMIIYNTNNNDFEAYFGGAINNWESISSNASEILLADGTELEPSLAFINDMATGLFLVAPGNLGVTVSANQVLGVTTAGLNVYGNGVTPGNIKFYTEDNARYVELSAPTSLNLPSTIAFNLPGNYPIYNNVPLVSDTFGDLYFSVANNVFATGQVLSTDIKGMFTTPVDILSPLPSGQSYIIHDFSINSIYASSPFFNGGNIYLQYGSAASGTPASQVIPAAAIKQSNNTVSYAGGGINAGTGYANSSVANGQGVYLTNDTAAFINGNGLIRIYVWYSIVNNFV